MARAATRVEQALGLRVEIFVPPVKSISHRAALAALISAGQTTVYHYLPAEDTLATLDAIQAFGATLERTKSSVHIAGVGLRGAR